MSHSTERATTETERPSIRGARLVGRLLQAAVLAALLVLAFMKLLMYAGSSVVFRYQGF